MSGLYPCVPNRRADLRHGQCRVLRNASLITRGPAAADELCWVCGGVIWYEPGLLSKIQRVGDVSSEFLLCGECAYSVWGLAGVV
jgi:hypothetical protein